MSLLHRGTETVTVFPEETFTDEDGNPRTRLSSIGVVVRAVVQPMTFTEQALRERECTDGRRISA